MSGMMTEVRELLLKSMKELSDPENSPEETSQTISRAKATSDLAQTFINSVRAEVEARVKLDEKKVPQALEEGRLIEGSRRG